MDYVIIVGLVAGFTTTIGYIPQIIKGYRSGRMDDVSVFMPFVLMVGMGLWLAYGILLQDIPIILWNAVSVSLNAVIILMKFRFSRKDNVPVTS